MRITNLAEYFNSICEFRQIYPIIKGQPLRTSDLGIIPIRETLHGLKKILEEQYPEIDNIKLSVDISRGITNLPHVLYACILPPGQLVPNGIYTAICFDIFGRGALIGCVESKVTSKGLTTVQRKKTNILLSIDVDGSSERTKYNNVFVNPKEFYYPLDSPEIMDHHIRKSIKLSFDFLNKEWKSAECDG